MTAPQILDDWLAFISTQHRRGIDLGLERVAAVLRRMELGQPVFRIVTVGGTNGKGSCVAMLAAILRAAGYRVGAYTSPHLGAYNERVRIGDAPAGDAELCEAFARVEAARGETPLTYFEFGTLAAFDLFQRGAVEIAVLEVGLGGRLDAVNVLDADVALITSVDIDHTDWLGPDRESIGREKAGIFRAARPAVCADPMPPRSVVDAATQLGTRLYRFGADFGFTAQAAGWSWWGPSGSRAGLPVPAIPGAIQLRNAAAVLMVLDLLAPRFGVNQAQVRAGLLEVELPGRFQTLPGRPLRVLDVAHNPEAARNLAENLRRQPVSGRTFAVVAMLRDKPVAEVLRVLAGVVDEWHVSGLDCPRGASADEMLGFLRAAGVTQGAQAHADVAAAYAAACARAGTDDRVLVFGSFHTVGAILHPLSDTADLSP